MARCNINIRFRSTRFATSCFPFVYLSVLDGTGQKGRGIWRHGGSHFDSPDRFA